MCPDTFPHFLRQWSPGDVGLGSLNIFVYGICYTNVTENIMNKQLWATGVGPPILGLDAQLPTHHCTVFLSIYCGHETGNVACRGKQKTCFTSLGWWYSIYAEIEWGYYLEDRWI